MYIRVASAMTTADGKALRCGCSCSRCRAPATHIVIVGDYDSSMTIRLCREHAGAIGRQLVVPDAESGVARTA